MPQIWLTYEEIGELYGRSANDGRAFAIEAGLDRRQCSDGRSRAKLPDGAARAFMIAFARHHSRVSALDLTAVAAEEPAERVSAFSIESPAQQRASLN